MFESIRLSSALLFLVGLSGLLLGCSVAERQTTLDARNTATNSGAVAPGNFARPNVVLLFADDLGYGDLSSFGHPNISTPNLDALAAGGQRWTDFYVAAPVCSPSRGALLTGRLPNRTGLYGERLAVLFPEDSRGMPDEEITLAEALGGAGYATAILGKWHLGSEAAVYPTRHGFDYWYGLPYSNDMDWVGSFTFKERLAAVIGGPGLSAAQQAESDGRVAKYAEPKIDYWNVPLIRSTRQQNAAGAFDYSDEIVERPAQQPTLTQRYTDEALSFIDRNRDKPFFVYLPYTMPHTPLFASTRYQGTSRGGVYGDVIEEIDGSVGQIIDGLTKRGLAANTLVIFSSDNGPWLVMQQNGGSSGPFKMGKGTTFEGGMRVPTVFSWPGTIAPDTVHDIGAALDLMPTILKAAGIAQAEDTVTDGVDLLPRLLGDESTGAARQSMPFYRAGELRAWRQGPWKLHLIVEGAYGVGPEKTVLETPQLYHLGRDPGERFDVAKQNPQVVAEIEKAITEHKAQLTSRPPLFDARLAEHLPAKP